MSLGILFLSSRPDGHGDAVFDREARAIQDKLQRVRDRDRFAFHSRWAVTRDDVVQALLEIQPKILHFSCHGSPHVLDICDEQGQLAPLSGRALAGLLAALETRVNVVVLNACSTRETAEALLPAVDYAIGVPAEITGDEARSFAGSFYRGLGFGYSVDQAYHLAIAAMGLEHESSPRVAPELHCIEPTLAGSLPGAAGNGNGSTHPLHRIPRGPMVPSHFITHDLLESYADLFDSPPTMRTALSSAVSMRRQADPDASVVRFGDVPQPAYGAYQFWEAVFFEARKHGPRMVASLLDLTSDDGRLGDRATRDRETLLQYLEKGAWS